MENPRISVIIPVYNTSKYLERCIDSVIAQQEQSLEIILVDDGSTDESPAICDEYALKDKRIRVVHKQNGGVSSARNTGLDMAHGKWVSFIDSDDEITPDFFNIPSVYEDAQVIHKPDVYVYPDGTEKKCPIITDRYITSHREVGNSWINRSRNYLAIRIIARECIQNERFLENVKISEDFLFFTSILHSIYRYAFCPIGCYKYYQHSDSAMGKFKNDIREDVRITFEHFYIVKSFMYHKNMVEICENLMAGYFLKTLWKRRKYLTDKEKDTYKEMLSEMKLSWLSLCNLKTKIGMGLVKYIGIHAI